MDPMPPTGAPAGRGPIPMTPGPPPTPVKLVRALMGSSGKGRAQMVLRESGKEKWTRTRVHSPGPPCVFLSVNERQAINESVHPLFKPLSQPGAHCHQLSSFLRSLNTSCVTKTFFSFKISSPINLSLSLWPDYILFRKWKHSRKERMKIEV